MEILNKIQKELKAPKSQRNSFGNYNYRSCEDILEAVKPLLGTATLTIEDDIVIVGDRYYVKATATIKDKDISESVSAYARESLEKKGMDSSQITGATSSYARKYALNGLFCIDDTKDADNTNTHGKDGKAGNGENSNLDLPLKSNVDLALNSVLTARTEEEREEVLARINKSNKMTEDEKIEFLNKLQEHTSAQKDVNVINAEEF